MNEDRHWEHDHKRNYVTVEPFHVVSSEEKIVEIEIEDEPIQVNVWYHYSEEIPGDRVNPPDPATVEVIMIKEVEEKEGREVYGRTLYSIDGKVNLISDEVFEDLSTSLLENWGY